MANIVTGHSYIPKNLTPRAFAIGRPQNTEWARLNRSFNDDFERVRESFGDEVPIHLKGSVPESFFRIFGPQKDGYAFFIRGAALFECSQLKGAYNPPEEAKEPIASAQTSVQLHTINNSHSFENVHTLFVDGASLPENKLGRHLPFINTSIINDSLTPGEFDFLITVAHETLHGNSFGFAAAALDEGATSYFTNEVCEHPLFSVFYPEYMEKHRMLETLGRSYSYSIETLAIDRLVEVAGREAVYEAFFRGDESGLLTKFGTQKWNSIKDLAFAYHGRNADIRYLEAFSKILQIPIAGKPKNTGRIII